MPGTLASLATAAGPDDPADERAESFGVARLPDLEALVQALMQAFRRRDLAAALQRAAALRKRFPQAASGYEIGALALRDLQRHEEAAALLGQAAARFAGAEWLLAGTATLAARQGAWGKVEEAAAALRRAFPDNHEGYLLGLRSLRHQKRLAAAGVLLEQALAALPGNVLVLTEAAILAHEGSQYEAALGFWRRVQEAAPNQRNGFEGAVKACLAAGRLDEAEQLLREAEPGFAGAAWLLSQSASLANKRGDLEQAARLWAGVRAAHPDHEPGYNGQVRTLLQMNRLDDAEAVLQEALVRFPMARWALIEAAMLARLRSDFAEADRRFAHAVATLPNDPEVALKHATACSLHAHRDQQNWPVTLQRLQALHERFPHFSKGWDVRIRALRAVGDSAGADRLASECIQRMPDQPDIWLEYAAGTAADGENAADRLAAGAARFPNHAAMQNGYAKALMAAGRLDEADEQYRQTAQRFPELFAAAFGFAELAMRREDWREAVRRWQDVRRRFPNHPGVAVGLLDAYAALGEGPAVLAARPFETHGAGQAKAPQAEMFRRFESLGGTGLGCEFGLVQRAAGAEPIGLLRWTTIVPNLLIEALVNRFEGVGSPQQTFLDFHVVNDPTNPEYTYRDTRYRMAMHTFINKKDLPQDQALAQVCRRMVFLRQKLLEDLEDGEKIFVYKYQERNLTSAELARLHDAVRGYGNATLLYVRYADEEHPSGTVEQIGDGLIVGYISGFMIGWNGEQRPAALPAWYAICEAALDLHTHRLNGSAGSQS